MTRVLKIVLLTEVRVPLVSIFVRITLLCLQLKELSHDNIEAFIGACIEPGHICYLMQCCSRGTVQVSLMPAYRDLKSKKL